MIDLHLGKHCDEAPPAGATFLDWLRRTRRSDVAALILTGDLDPAWVNRANDRDALLLHKPIDLDQLRPFVRRAVTARIDGGARLALEVARYQAEYGLNDRDEVILHLALRGVPRTAMPATLGVNVCTFKDHVRALLRKTSAPSLDALAARIFRTGLGVSN